MTKQSVAWETMEVIQLMLDKVRQEVARHGCCTRS